MDWTGLDCLVLFFFFSLFSFSCSLFENTFDGWVWSVDSGFPFGLWILLNLAFFFFS